MDWMASLAQHDVHKVAELVERARVTDGVGPLSEQAMLNLASEDGSLTRHLIIHSWSGDFVVNATAEIQLDLAGYAQLDLETGSTEFVVAPKLRERGLGSRLLAAALVRSTKPGCAPLKVWSHGDLAAAQALANKFALERERTVLQLFRLTPPAADDALPAQLAELRPFRPGDDDAAWLELNGQAFAWHPEQGSWTQKHLDQRLEEEWFDPEGFLLASDAEGPVGFVWTKMHDVDPPVGEIYVIGVAPRAQRQGLGSYLTRRGMAHLATRGAKAIMLYVESDNTAALGAYQQAGFQTMAKDVQYRPTEASLAVAAQSDE